MSTRDPRVDAYIARAPDFAKPILAHLRAVVHSACPECVETMKWSHPSFTYKGLLGGMAAFKEHCTFGFWKGALIVDHQGQKSESAGNFGRITRIADLPSKKVLSGYVKEGMRLNDESTTVKRAPKATAKKAVTIPKDLTSALTRNKKA